MWQRFRSLKCCTESDGISLWTPSKTPMSFPLTIYRLHVPDTADCFPMVWKLGMLLTNQIQIICHLGLNSMLRKVQHLPSHSLSSFSHVPVSLGRKRSYESNKPTRAMDSQGPQIVKYLHFRLKLNAEILNSRLHSVTILDKSSKKLSTWRDIALQINSRPWFYQGHLLVT